MNFYTNIVFFFAGIVIVYMPYYLRNFQLVVSVLCTHSTGRKSKVGISIEGRRSTLLPRYNTNCRGVKCPNLGTNGMCENYWMKDISLGNTATHTENQARVKEQYTGYEAYQSAYRFRKSSTRF